jgi:hypothetical protein
MDFEGTFGFLPYGFPIHFKGLLCIVMEILRFKGLISLNGHDRKVLDGF